MFALTAALVTKPRQRSVPVCARLLRSRSLTLAKIETHDYFNRRTLNQIAPKMGRTSTAGVLTLSTAAPAYAWGHTPGDKARNISVLALGVLGYRAYRRHRAAVNNSKNTLG